MASAWFFSNCLKESTRRSRPGFYSLFVRTTNFSADASPSWDRLYLRVVETLDDLLQAVGLKAA